MKQKAIRVEGIVVKGVGEGEKYVSKPYYFRLFTELLKGKKPYPGTLNILCNYTYKHLLKRCKPYIHQTISLNGKVLGGFYYWYAKLKPKGIVNSGGVKELDVIVLRPFLSKHSDYIIEIISSKYLRGTLNLRDGDIVEIEITCNSDRDD